MMPTSGGTGDIDPFARYGTGDGPEEPAGDDAKAAGMVETDKMIEDNRNSLIDAVGDMYGPPHKPPKDRERMVAAGRVDVVQNHGKLPDSRRPSRDFDTARKGPKGDRKSDSQKARGLFEVQGRTPLHVRLVAYESYDPAGKRRTEARKPGSKLIEPEGGDWMRVGHLKEAAWYAADERHRLKAADMRSNLAPTPALLTPVPHQQGGQAGLLRVGLRRRPRPGRAEEDAARRDRHHRLPDARPEPAARIGLRVDGGRRRPPPTLGEVPDALRPEVERLAREWAGDRPRGWSQVEAVLTKLRVEYALLEDLTGLGKTTLAKAVAAAVGGTFARVQCTPDLLPGDITGFSIFNQKTREFEFQPGPVFSDVLLADEINRTTPRTQSALLEAMAERQATVDNVLHTLAPTFFVIATQNPVEHHGTYPLPEAQLDRFAMKLSVGYPERADELDLLAAVGHVADPPGAGGVLADGELAALQGQVAAVAVQPNVRAYLVDLGRAPRAHPKVTVLNTGTFMRRLQFGHGVEAVEMWSSSIHPAARSCRLQFGHGFHAVEIPPHPGATRHGRRASIRPRLPRRGDNRGNETAVHPKDASIRPRLPRRGDEELVAWLHERSRRLQFGHGFHAVEITTKFGRTQPSA